MIFDLNSASYRPQCRYRITGEKHIVVGTRTTARDDRPCESPTLRKTCTITYPCISTHSILDYKVRSTPVFQSSLSYKIMTTSLNDVRRRFSLAVLFLEKAAKSNVIALGNEQNSQMITASVCTEHPILFLRNRFMRFYSGSTFRRRHFCRMLQRHIFQNQAKNQMCR